MYLYFINLYKSLLRYIFINYLMRFHVKDLILTIENLIIKIKYTKNIHKL